METPVAVRFTRFGKDGLRALVTGSRSLAGTIAYWEVRTVHRNYWCLTNSSA